MGFPMPPWEGAILGERVAHCKVWGLSAMSCAETAESNHLPFGLWTRLGWAEGSTSSIIFARWSQCAHMGGHIWRHLANTIEPSVCGGDAVFCQITLTTCYCYCIFEKLTFASTNSPLFRLDCRLLSSVSG